MTFPPCADACSVSNESWARRNSSARASPSCTLVSVDPARSVTRMVAVCDMFAPLASGYAPGLSQGDDARELQDPRGRQVLFGDLDAEVGERVLDGVRDGRWRADHASFADAAVVRVDRRRRLDVVDLDL